jgi:hypothetical protein
MCCVARHRNGATPAIPSFDIVSRRRHLSRLPCGALRAALTGSAGGAEQNPWRRECQAEVGRLVVNR